MRTFVLVHEFKNGEASYVLQSEHNLLEMAQKRNGLDYPTHPKIVKLLDHLDIIYEPQRGEFLRVFESTTYIVL